MKNIYQIKEGITIMKNVVIIGAGPAGLTAAYELLQRAPKDYSVTILEESNAIGGISKTVWTSADSGSSPKTSRLWIVGRR